ncbi:MAG: hypothetical protein LBU83_00220 [Bacteroidales bacterium]|jgi:hypothetical protein|nr:hypothetical protein [Bacteroidales bacterium]
MITFVVCVILAIGIYAIIKSREENSKETETKPVNQQSKVKEKSETENDINVWGVLLTEKERETSNQYRQLLMKYRSYLLKDEYVRPPESVVRELDKSMEKFPQLIYQHALLRYGILPSSDNLNDHRKVAQYVLDTFPDFVDLCMFNAESQEKIDKAVYELIMEIVEVLKEIE